MVGDPTKGSRAVSPKKQRSGSSCRTREEDERKTRAIGRVSAEREEMIHNFQEEHKDMDLQESLKKRGFAVGLSQHPNRIGIPKEGPTLCFEF